MTERFDTSDSDRDAGGRGDDRGCLTIYTDPALVGHVLEISPAGSDAARTSCRVREYPSGYTSGNTEYVAEFGELPEGSYTVWQAGLARVRDVVITAGQVTKLDWRKRLTI